MASRGEEPKAARAQIETCGVWADESHMLLRKVYDRWVGHPCFQLIHASYKLPQSSSYVTNTVKIVSHPPGDRDTFSSCASTMCVIGSQRHAPGLNVTEMDGLQLLDRLAFGQRS